MARINEERPAKRDGLQLTERDKQIIRAVADFRLVSTDDLQLLTGSKSRRKLNDRLRELWGNRLLDRPEVARRIFAYAEKRHTVHALGSEGAKYLQDQEGYRFPESVDWTKKNKELKETDFVLHELGNSRTMIRTIVEVEKVAGLLYFNDKAVWQTSASFNESVGDPFSLPTELRWIDGRSVARHTKPDYTFVIGDQRTGKLRRGLFFREYDRATEDYVRSSPHRSSYLQKWLGYADAWQRGLHTDRFGLRTFRVQIVTEGDQAHIENMIKVYQTHVSDGMPAGALHFATVTDFLEHGPLAPIWIDANRQPAQMIESTPPPQSSSQVPRLAASRA